MRRTRALHASLQGGYWLIYICILAVPGRTHRERKLRAHSLAVAAQAFLKKAGPLFIGIGVNLVLVGLLAFVVFHHAEKTPPRLEASFEILTPTTEIPQDIGPSALEQATAGSANALMAPAPPAPDVLSAVTTTATNPLQFSVATPTMQTPTLPAIKSGAAQVTGNGNGAGQGVGAGIGNGNGSGRNGNGGGKIGGMQVNARSLGVLLDDSGSMKPHLNGVRAEIHKSFNGATTQEVQGCAVVYAEDAHRPNLDAQPNSVVRGVAYLLRKNRKIDAIYWFSDLQDPITPEGLTQLQDLLLQNGVKLYVRSLQMMPQSIIDLTEITGGDFEVRNANDPSQF